MITGVAVSAMALILVYAILPFARDWADRAAALEAKAEQAARLEALVESEAELRAVVDELQARRDRRSRRLLTGTTPVLAASVLQTLVRSYAEESLVTLQRIDAARDFEAADDGLVPIGLQVTARGDVYGLVELLYLLQHGEKLLVIDDLRVNAAARRTARDQAIITWTINLHGYYAPEDARS